MFAAPNFFLAGAAGDYLVIQQFTASGTWVAPTGVTKVDYLVVAGGGGAGGSFGGVGGGGEIGRAHV